jgi:RHS repeat-associated protein
VLAGLVCAGLVGTSVSPAWAGPGDPDAGTGSAVVGGFGLGDGLEGMVSERDGAFQVDLRVADQLLRWDSNAVGGGDASGLGRGWSWGFGGIDTKNGVRVTPASGGSFPADPTHPSGLAGYGVRDVVFEQRAGTHAAHSGESIDYAYVLYELGGLVTYFSADGDPVARVDAVGKSTEWRWDALVPHRLLGTVDADGVHTVFDWSSEPGAVLVHRSTHPGGDPSAGAGVAGEVWRIELDGARVSAVVDPLGGRVSVDYADGGDLLDHLAAPSGATTQVAWRMRDDGIARVERVRSTDPDGTEVSVREWTPAGDGTPSSGWPRYPGERAVFQSGDPSFRYHTVVSDGATRVESEYNSSHLLIARRMVGSTSSGEVVLHEQAFGFPGTEDGGVADPEALPANWSRPAEVEVTFHDARGGTRSQHERFTFDSVGRAIERTGPDGTVTTTAFDEEVPEGARLPIGRPLVERTVAPDGQTQTVTHTLDADRVAVVRSEAIVGTTPEDDGVITGLVEYEPGPRGLVAEERVYPAGDRSAAPRVTRWDEQVDLAAGTKTSTRTIGAGMAGEATVTERSPLLHGGVLESIDALGRVGRVAHDALGRPVEATDASGRTTTVEYESLVAHGRNATTTTTPDGVASTELLDVLGRVAQLTDNLRDGYAESEHVRVVETRTYPEPGTMVVTDAWGASTTTRQDVFGRTVETEGPTGLTQVTVYDDVANTVTAGLTATGRLADAELVFVQTVDVAGRVAGTTSRRSDGGPVTETEHRYDGFGRPLFQSDGTLTATTEWDAFGNPVVGRLASAGTAEAASDAADRASAASVTTTRRFDGFGNSVEKTVSDTSSARSGGTRAVDEVGRTVSETDQLGRVSEIEYTVDGLVSCVLAGGGQLTEHTYDPLTRAPTAVSVTSPVGAAVRTAYAYDPVTDRVIGAYDPADRAGTEVRVEWNDQGNPVRTTYPGGATVEFAYDAHGRRVGMTDVAGATTSYTYDSAGLMVGAVQIDHAERELARVGYVHDAYGRVTELSRGNDVVTRMEYTSASEISREHTSRGGRTIADRRYGYDHAGRLTSRTDTVVDPDPDPDRDAEVTEATTTRYTYDALGRLVASVVHDGGDELAAASLRTEYELTAAGDVAIETVTHAPGADDETGIRRSFEYDPRGGLTAVTTTVSAPSSGAESIEVQTQEFDAAGNLVRGLDGTVYAYDAANRTVAETDPEGGTVRTAFWADGSRRSLTDETGAATEFFWDGRTLVNETVAGERAGVSSYLIGTHRHARITALDEDASAHYYVTDRHGSVSELTDRDGAVTDRHRYSDYGVPLTPVGAVVGDLAPNPFGFAAEYTDHRGTQFLRIRTYEPATMRFTSVDPAPMHNPYAYADLNPITKIDPSGNNAESDLVNGLVIAAALISALITIVSTIYTGPAAIAAAGGTLAAAAEFGIAPALGVLSDFGATIIASMNIADDKRVDHVTDDEQRKHDLEIAEYSMLAAGVASMIPSAFRALRQWFGSARAAPQAAGSEISHIDVVSAVSPPPSRVSTPPVSSKGLPEIPPAPPNTPAASPSVSAQLPVPHAPTGKPKAPTSTTGPPTAAEVDAYRLRVTEDVWGIRLQEMVDQVEMASYHVNILKSIPSTGLHGDAVLSMSIATAERIRNGYAKTLVESLEWRVVRNPELLTPNHDWYQDLRHARLDGQSLLDSFQFPYQY